MFHYLRGTVGEILPGAVVIDCGGIGFAVYTTARSISTVRVGEEAKFYTIMNIREDHIQIFGFTSTAEQAMYEMLITVTGVGPKAALSILSAASPEDLAYAIATENTTVFTSAPGIGKKIAQRIILDLKDKVAKDFSASSLDVTVPVIQNGKPGSSATEAATALAVLGYTPAEISALMKKIDTSGMSVEDIIKTALRMQAM